VALLSCTPRRDTEEKAAEAVSLPSVLRVAREYGVESAQLAEFAQYLHVDSLEEPELLPLVAENMLEPLPSGWIECEDEASGLAYYYHAETLTSCWEYPGDLRCRAHESFAVL
jgi:hypothetical protein